MKIITAMVQPFMLSKITGALEEIDGFPGMTVSDVRGFGREKSIHGQGMPHSVMEEFVEYVKKGRIEIEYYSQGELQRLYERLVNQPEDPEGSSNEQ